MKKLALIVLAAASLVGTSGVASAQYGGGYYGDRYYGDRYRERYYDDDRYHHRRDSRGSRAVDCGPGASAYRTASASHIAATEIDLLSWGRHFGGLPGDEENDPARVG